QLQDLQTPLVITQKSLQTRLANWDGPVWLLDEPESWPGVASDDEANLTSFHTSEHLAYIIYTSGSTGVPKGVMVRHSGVLNYTYAMSKRIASQPGLHFATVSTPAADLGNTSIFCSLLSGGCLHILTHETVLSGHAFADYLEQHPIDVLKIVPSHLSALLASCNGRAILPARHLILGGEALPYTLLRRLTEVGGKCRVINHYGPTEATIGALVNMLGSLEGNTLFNGSDVDEAFVPIGRPIEGMEAYILDRFGHLVPRGMTGELYLGGRGLAAGYWRQPAQTQERFVPHPWSVAPEARLYRTGDLARYREDGTIAFVGRSDSQVKLRGYRIELGEVEGVLQRHPSVRECVVLLREDTPDDRRLVAYIIAQPPLVASQALSDFLREHVPGYMVPGAFVFLSALPLTNNGKVDFRQLPAPEQHEGQRTTTYVAPRTPTEEIIAGIWQSALQVERVGIHDHFASLGGHSLLAMRIVSRLRQVLQVDIPLRLLFETATIANLSEQIEQLQGQFQSGKDLPLVPVERTDGLPLSFAQQRLWFLQQLEPANVAYLLPRAQRLTGILDVAALKRSFAELVRRHESLRTTFEERAGRPVQIIHPATDHCLPLIDLQGLPVDEGEALAQSLAEQEICQPCSLAQGPLLRTYLLRLEGTEHILLLTMHHILTDAWSNEIFLRELALLYRSFRAKEPSPLTELTIQYADFAVWQRQWLRGEVIEEQMRYWRQQLADAAWLELPTDHPRPPIQTFHGAYQLKHMPLELRTALMRLSRKQEVTVFMTLLAAFQVLLARYSGQDDISVGTGIANRSRPELEGLIGFFVNTLVMRVNLADNPSFVEVLRRVREVALGAYTHQDVPFEQLVEALQPERDNSRSPFFQVALHLRELRGNEAPEQIEELDFGVLNTERSTTKFDLTLNIASSPHGLRCGVEYRTDLFEERSMARFLEQYQRVLEAVVEAPETRLGELPLLGEQERRDL
ncbi:MAG TPA: amino acid adenylation domain-containing protein, partial [Ktedonobacteraceae bacterium]|nr:amino acid adenylation domain-containing protein [Ktedonobacteraceae bacterium]